MIQINGKLSVKEIKGRSGTFCVGDLVTEIGTFKVKDAILDQYPPRDYEGRFGIEEIYPSSYSWRGKVWVEIRARLSMIEVDTEPETPDAETLPEGVEPDPADEVPQVPQKPADEAVEAKAVGKTGLDLFDSEARTSIEAGEPVKLDPTVDRNLFRSQRDVLKGLGYRFDAGSQMWAKPAE